MPTLSPIRRIAAALALVVAAGFAVLAAIVIARGGFDVNGAGLRIGLHDPQRPVLLAGVAIGLFAWSQGFARSWAAARDVSGRVDERLVAAAFAAGPIAWGLSRGSLAGSASGGVLVLATHRLGRDVACSRTGLMAAWLVALSPTLYLAETSAPIDVAAAAAWTIAWVMLRRGTTATALGAGVLASVAMVLRSELAPIAGVMLLSLVWRATAGGGDRRLVLRHAVCFAGAAVQGAVIAGALNFVQRGSALAFDGSDLALATFVPNAQAYVSAFTGLYTMWPILGATALLLPWREVWPDAAGRRLAAAFGPCLIVVGVEGCLQTAWPSWEALRFFLPGWPLLMIGCAATARYAMRVGPPPVKLLAAWLIVWIGLRALLAGLGRGVFG